MAQIIWTELARSDVENIFHYYETISSLLAETIVDEIFDSVYYLKKNARNWSQRTFVFTFKKKLQIFDCS